MARETDVDEKDLNSAEGENAEAARSAGPFSIQFPTDLRVWNEARRLAADKNIRVEDLAVCALQDPVIVIDLLRISNAMFFSGGRSPITSTKTAIVRLGSDVVIDALDKMKDRQLITDEQVSHWVELHRSRCRRTAIIARILGEAVIRQLADDCQAAGLLINVGEMLAAAHLREAYVKLAEEHSRSGVNFRLAQDHKFDVERMGLTYLRRCGIPEALLFAIDRDARSRTPDRAIMKPLCMAAAELVDAFDTNRWEKLAPGRPIPPKSAIRMLQITDSQYMKIYERSSEYLFSARLLEEKNRRAAVETSPEAWQTAVPVASETPAPQSDDSDALEDEIQTILHTEHAEDEFEDEYEDEVEEVAPQKPPRPTVIHEVSSPLIDKNDSFSLGALKSAPKTVARVKERAEVVTPPRLRTSKGSEVVSSIANTIFSAQTSEQLLSELLEMLVDNGPFEKSALMVVSKDRRHALVVAARGPNIGNGQKLSLDDPLSPIAQCFSKVQSFGNRSSENSPFGSKSFALAPIDADHETPVVLYADCGNNGSLTFEARRIFRTVVEILNQRLPAIPGGIPVEVK